MEHEDLYNRLESVKTNLISIPKLDDVAEQKLMAMMHCFNDLVESLGTGFTVLKIVRCPQGPLEKR